LGFKKGQKAWNKGKKATPEQIKKMSESHKVQKPWNKDKKQTPEHRRKNIESHKGQKPWNKDTKGIMKPNSTSFKKGQIPWSKGLTKETSELVRKIAEKRKGQKRTPEQRKKMSVSHIGLQSLSKHPLWGKHHSEATKQKMSKMKIGSNHPNFGKRLSSETRKKISVARQKQKLPFKDAKSTEIPLQKLLKKTGISFETQKNLQGQPDIFIKPNICIFADGDYFHGWKYIQGEDFSRFKIFNNNFFEKRIKNDENNTRILTEDGYNVLRFWEHEIKENPEKCLQEIIKIIKESKPKS